MKYIDKNYIPKGELTGFPLEIIDKMLEEQVQQCRCLNAHVFEKNCTNNPLGFDWQKTKDGYGFWFDVIHRKLFHVFFEKYPKQTYPRVMMVSDDTVNWKKRVVFMKKKDIYLAWANAETIEASENASSVISWKCAMDIEPKQKSELIHLTIEDISAGKGVGVDPALIRIKQ